MPVDALGFLRIVPYGAPSLTHPLVPIDHDFHSVGELTALLKCALGISYIGVQTEPGELHGHIRVALTHGYLSGQISCNRAAHLAGRKNPHTIIFATTNQELPDQQDYEWRGHALGPRMVGGFLSDDVSCFKLANNGLMAFVVFPRKTFEARMKERQCWHELRMIYKTNFFCAEPETFNAVATLAFIRNSFPGLPGKHSIDVRDRIIDYMVNAAWMIWDPFLESETRVLDSAMLLEESIADPDFDGKAFEQLTGLKTTQLNKGCNRMFQLSPKRLITRLRLEQIQLLMRNPEQRLVLGLKNAADCAGHWGIPSADTFRSAYKGYFGRPPSEDFVDKQHVLNMSLGIQMAA